MNFLKTWKGLKVSFLRGESIGSDRLTQYSRQTGWAQYYNIQLKQPSAQDMFEQIIKASKGKQILMFLDYDGTLSPIVDDPDRAFMSDAVRVV